MKKKAGPVENEVNIWDSNSNLWPYGFQDLGTSTYDLSSASIPNVPYFDLRIYRESRVKSLIKLHSKDMYRLLEKVHFDGNYYRVKCASSGEWEYCWDLAVRVQFFGKMLGMTLYPKRLVSQKEKRITYRSMIIVNPYQLWDEALVSKFWNLQERVEFLIARILFHECIHVMISLGNHLPSGFGNTDIYFEFRKMIEVSVSRNLSTEYHNVLFRLWNLVLFGASGSESEKKLLERVQEIYEFLINEKYSNQKTGKAFRFPSNNKKIARKYAWMAAVKAGGDMQVSKRVWQVEARRLSIALRELFDGIDTELNNMGFKLNSKN
ncbi:hypothetical protein EQO05_02560 [Methanosarcina sp. MSH10X1]|uniref:hypothetical protein n=1 Tax=Methanosarcina sp. MSH10X1 TaxID=2507075 RepID=UPI000FFBC29A|nr:hypothetical protein [Methanosarcina sp. MSH10X1]RXA21323.1 hypothetical protein EQO05_02560 [Methanosarcina sp. MSH10X1]